MASEVLRSPFSAEWHGLCPKCTGTTWSYRWYGARSIMSNTERSRELTRYAEPEHLHLTCVNCGWGFDMETADAEEGGIPLWGEGGPDIGQVIPVKGTGESARWNGMFWELVK